MHSYYNNRLFNILRFTFLCHSGKICHEIFLDVFVGKIAEHFNRFFKDTRDQILKVKSVVPIIYRLKWYTVHVSSVSSVYVITCFIFVCVFHCDVILFLFLVL